MSEPSKQVTLLPTPEELNPIQLVTVAVQHGADTEQLKELLQLQREWKADKAREAFVEAMTAFRAEPLTVTKQKQVRYSTKTGGVTEYKHATLAQVVDAVVAALSKHGLAHRWETKQDGGLIAVSCVLTHTLGHSERVSLTAAPDESGGKNSIQAVGSTVSYLQRYTLMAITGLAAKDMDDDAVSATVEKINEKQIADLDALITEVGADKAAFLGYMKVEKLDQIPLKAYSICVKALEAKRRQKKVAK